MRHQKKGRKFNRNSSHRKAMFSNMVTSLIEHKRIQTTEAKAKELRGIAEKTINWGVKSVELIENEAKLSQEDRAKLLHNRRMASRVVRDKAMLQKLFNEVAPALKGRPGGYTRVLKTRVRRGDAAPMAMIEIVA